MGRNSKGDIGFWQSETSSIGSEFVSSGDNQKAWYGNFVGPGPDQNPYKIVGPDGKYLQPINMLDAAAQVHDYAYWQANYWRH